MSEESMSSPGFPPPPPPFGTQPDQSSIKQRAYLVLQLGLALVILGSILPWAKATAGFAQFEKNGMEGDGQITVILAGIALVWTFFRRSKGQTKFVLGPIAGLLCLIIAIIDIADVSSIDTGAAFVTVQVGIGLWVCLFGGIATCISVMIGRSKGAPSSP
jgi:hypothetical protein